MQGKGASGADAQPDVFGVSGSFRKIYNVFFQTGADMDVLHLLFQRHDFFQGNDRGQVGRSGIRASSENGKLLLLFRVAHADFHKETVHLRFRQVVGAVGFHRVLGSKHHKRLGQPVGFSFHADLSFFHDFQQGGLCFGRGTVDFVG